jgi:RimJ/RimL family protein N-acetyltransferase
MSYSLEPAFIVERELSRLLIKASIDSANQWFFVDGAFTANVILEQSPNTWLHENFVVLCGKEIVAYFEGTWNRPLDIISGFRFILLDKTKARSVSKAFFQYLDYLFVLRGCKVFNWTVAEKNVHAYKIYEKFIKRYCGHRVGKRTHAQKGYTGEVSDSFLYELTRDEYFTWKNTVL